MSPPRDMSTEDATGECNCQIDPFDISSHVATILDDGDIPLVSVSIEGKPNISRTSVHQGQSTCEFVALSHVRSQNLILDGTSKCSLQQLQSLVNELLQSKILLSLSTTLPFWIDTICIPEDHRKQTATKKIKRVFEAADAVLVLESSLYCQRPGSISDYIAAIRCSPWTKRLWTLQEAALAKRLCFRFHNMVVLLDDLTISLEATEPVTAVERVLRTENTKEVREKLDCLDLLDADIKSLFAASTNVSHTSAKDMVKEDKPEVAPEAYWNGTKKLHLRSILRLGYLSLPRFYLIRDVNENSESQAVMEQILTLYNTEYGAGRGMKTSMSKEMRLEVLVAFKLNSPLKEQSCDRLISCVDS